MMKDLLVKGVSRGLGLRAVACVNNNLANEICSLQRTSPLGSVLLTRALSAAALSGGLIGSDQRIGLKFEGNGPAGMLLAEADGRGSVKGFISNPDIEAQTDGTRIDLSGAVGTAGLLTVVRDIGLAQPHQSTVHLVSGLIGEDLAYYFTASEQVPSAVGVSSSLDAQGRLCCCGGFIVQALPGEGGRTAGDETLETVIENIRGLEPLQGFLEHGGTPADLLRVMFTGIPFEIIQETGLRFSCSCSRERLARALAALGSEKISTMIKEDEGAEAVCEYCRRKYLFSSEDLAGLLHNTGNQTMKEQ